MQPDLPPVCDYEGSDYQASFWDRGGRDYEDHVEAIAIRRLLPPSGEQLLEIGAGAGRNTLRYTGFDRIVLLDYSHSQLQQAQARLGRSPRFTYVVADAYRLPFIPGAFDATTLIRTLHHIADVPRMFTQVQNVLQPGGVFVLEYANKQNLKAILRYILGRQDWNPFNLNPVEFVKLNFDFHPHAIQRWLQDSGFTTERQLTVSHFRLGFLKRAVPVSWLVALDSAAQLTGNWWQLSPSVFLRARTTSGIKRELPTNIFRCPECGNFPLEETENAIICPSCSEVWSVKNGIYIFRH